MYKFVVSILTFVVILLSSLVEGQLMCYQGTTAITAAENHRFDLKFSMCTGYGYLLSTFRITWINK